MKSDIRDILKQEDTSKPLPENHREEFLKKLQSREIPKQKSKLWLKIAAVLVVGLAIVFSIGPFEKDSSSQSSTISQMGAIETQYLQDIEKEWQNFIAVADDDVLVSRFRNKLKDLSDNYEDISLQFKSNPNNVQVIEALVDNLQTRLQLIKDIQNHIKLLNQNNEQYENTM